MISCIICSCFSDISEELKQNIERTIGIDYELIVIDNSTNKYSIFSAYNEGVRRSKGDILCFMHEDILYKTENWGLHVYKHFDGDGKLGLIGVLGGHFLPDIPCHIGDSELLSSIFYYVADGKHTHIHHNKYFGEDSSSEVVAVDGLWFSISNTLFEKICFDENLNGFHYYDMDISMQIWASGYKCKVVDDVVVSHLSGGCINGDFINNTYLFYKKWNMKLPMVKGVSFDSDFLNMTKLMCVYKNYARELQYENDRIKKSRIYCVLLYCKKLRNGIMSIIWNVVKR